MTKGGPVEVTSRDGMEWHQQEQTIIAKGDAKAVRGTVTVTADELIAHYRKKAGTGASRLRLPTKAGTPNAAAYDPRGYARYVATMKSTAWRRSGTSISTRRPTRRLATMRCTTSTSPYW